MGKASPNQSSFLGGEWSKVAQGRVDDPLYRTALDTCLNSIPIEEGSLPRRPGTMFICRSYGHGYARLITFQSRESNAFCMEFTNHHLRLISGNSLLCVNDSGTPVHITGYSNPNFTTNAVHGFSVGDQLLMWFADGFDVDAMAGFTNAIWTVTATPTTTTLAINDDNGTPAQSITGPALRKVLNITTPWTAAQLPLLRSIQATTQAVLLHGSVKPYVLKECPSFALTAVDFVDGPYQDTPQPMAATVSGYSGSITLTAASAAFATTDTSGTGGTGSFDRHVRLFSEPAAWDVGTTYAAGDLTTYQGAYWQSSVGSNTGNYPNTQPTKWAPATNVQSWAWGKITGYTNSTTVTVALQTNLDSANGTTVAANDWYLGLYSDTTGYPSAGCYHEGRLWLAGAEENRFDGSMSSELFTFSPTDQYGNVADNHAIAEVLNSDDLNKIFWMTPDHQGILVGSLGGEFLIEATSANDVLTPTSIQAHRVTKYGCANILPVRAGMSVIFVQRYSQRLMEYLTDAFTGRFTGRHINEKAKHIAASGIAEIAYMEELSPTIWVRMNDGSLASVTYRRNSRFTTEAPVFAAWSRHEHGGS